MADWIKMRVDLYRDPKVIVMADALMAKDGQLAMYVNQNKQRDMTVTRNVMRNVTVGALVSIWGVARKQGKRIDDALVLADCCVSVLDDIAELPGIGEAMEAAGWVAQTEDGLLFPRFFEEHNTDYEEQKAKNRERQARFRAKKQAGNSNVTVTLRDAPEREKSKSKSNINTPVVPFKLDWSSVTFPDGCDTERVRAAVLEWLSYRRAIKKPYKMPAKQVSLLLAEHGADLPAAVSASIANGWIGCFRGNSGKAEPEEPSAPFVSYDYDAYLESQKLTPKVKP